MQYSIAQIQRRILRLWSWLHGLAFCLGIRRGIILCKNHILWLHMVAHKRAEFNIITVVF